MKPVAVPCAIYTRKSSEEGLEQGFNSLDAQREACASYVISQKSLGWVAVAAVYDDGGFSGGNVERPALQRLLADIALKKVRVVVVYKVDRLTRSLADFAKMVELFDAQGVSFVSVTQAFNTTSSMGRLTLNVLLSFAQFEREVTGERIRDKIAASKRKGMWMCGLAPVGYEPHERSLAIDEVQAARVREIYRLYLDLGCVHKVRVELERLGWVTPVRVTRKAGAAGGKAFSRGHLYRILSNPVYVGKIAHKKEVFAGNHAAVIDSVLWQEVQDRLAANRQGHRVRANAKDPSLLAGLVFDDQGRLLTPSHAQKGARRYRYYVDQSAHELGRQAVAVKSAPGLRIPAAELERAVVAGLIGLLGDEGRLLSAMGDVDAPTARDRLLRAREVAVQLNSPSMAIAGFVDRIEVAADRVTVAVRLDSVWGTPAENKSIVTVDVPVELKRCGMAVRLIVHESLAMARRGPDATMVALLAKAHDWAARLTSGRSSSILEISNDEGVTAGYVSRVIALAFLSPDIVERIARGEHPPQLNAQHLISQVPLPIRWEEQRVLLGFDH